MNPDDNEVMVNQAMSPGDNSGEDRLNFSPAPADAESQRLHPLSLTYFVLCVFANLVASQFLPWKREALENCFWDAICKRVLAKYNRTGQKIGLSDHY
jgi:hypothetical protein